MSRATVVDKRNKRGVGFTVQELFSHKHEGEFFVDDDDALVMVVQYDRNKYQLIAIPYGNRLMDSYPKGYRRFYPVKVTITIE